MRYEWLFAMETVSVGTDLKEPLSEVAKSPFLGAGKLVGKGKNGSMGRSNWFGVLQMHITIFDLSCLGCTTISNLPEMPGDCIMFQNERCGKSRKKCLSVTQLAPFQIFGAFKGLCLRRQVLFAVHSPLASFPRLHLEPGRG